VPIVTRIQEMLRLSDGSGRLFPATILFNEGWLLRLVLSWFSSAQPSNQVISFQPRATWFSEALLPSQFRPRSRNDVLAEGWTHADGVIGQITIGQAALADAEPLADASQLLITEAKLFSPLSRRVTNAAYFDQAARNVACLAEMLHLRQRPPHELKSLGFFVLAPLEQIDAGVFSSEMTRESLRDKVTRRVTEYHDPKKEQWLREWFLPTLEHARVGCASWESLLDHIHSVDAEFGGELRAFYSRCLEFNRLQEREQT
jgi:hypothetical protein